MGQTTNEEKMKGFFFAKGGALWPDGEESERAMRRMGDGEACEVEFKRPRNIILLRKYWRLCEYVAESCPGVETARQVDHVLKIETGNVEVFKIGDTLYQQAGSIAIGNMDEDGFSEYYRKCIKVILALFLPNISEQIIAEEIERMAGIRY